jgi:gliding motility-associated-like protein
LLQNSKKYLCVLLQILFGVAIGMKGFSQSTNLCTNPPSNSTPGDFEIVGGLAAGCTPFTVNLNDKSGGTDIRYMFDYRGGAASTLDKVGNTATTDALFSNTTSIRNYTILQYGKKGGKDMYKCLNVSVRPNSQPKFSYSTCNNNNIEISIPIDKANDFDYYNIDWGDGAPTPEKVLSSQLPFTKNRSLNLPKTIKLEGFLNSGALNCASPTSIVVPFLSPTVFPLGYEDINKVNIDQIELINGKKAEIEFHGSFDVNGYELFMAEKGLPYVSFKKNIMPGTFKIDIPDSTKSYCFYFSRPIFCGIDISPEICTIPILAAQPLVFDNEIKWSTYPTEISTSDNRLYGRYLDKKIEIVKVDNTTKAKLILPVTGANEVYFLDQNVNCKKKFCYRVELQTSGQLYYYKFKGKSISNEICVDRQSFEPPSISDLTLNVLNNNSVEIKYSDNSNWVLAKDYYYLFKEDASSFVKIDSSKTNVDFKDLTVDTPQKSYCYKIGYKDICESKSKLSPEICSVLLSVKTNDDLGWNKSLPFGSQTITDYEIIAFDEKTGNANSVQQLSSSVNEKAVDFKPFENEAKFKIKINGSNGGISYSNEVVVPIQALFFLPTVFTPNNDKDNNELELEGRLGRVAKLSLEIYNRWGEKIIELIDKNQTWDGQIKGKPAMQGLYYFNLNVILNNGEKVHKKGSFELIR